MTRALISAVALAFLLMLPQTSAAQELPKGTVVATPDKITWKPSPRTPGLEVADLVGDSTKPGPYVQRVKIPPNFVVQAHSHPEDRTYTVISGTWYVGWGDKYDPAKLIALPPGSFYTELANIPHFVATKSEPVIFQLSGNGPTAVLYVDPAHAPKK